MASNFINWVVILYSHVTFWLKLCQLGQWGPLQMLLGLWARSLFIPRALPLRPGSERCLHSSCALLSQPPNWPALRKDTCFPSVEEKGLTRHFFSLEEKKECVQGSFIFFLSQSVIISPNMLIFPVVLLSTCYIVMWKIQRWRRHGSCSPTAHGLMAEIDKSTHHHSSVVTLELQCHRMQNCGITEEEVKADKADWITQWVTRNEGIFTFQTTQEAASWMWNLLAIAKCPFSTHETRSAFHLGTLINPEKDFCLYWIELYF